MCAGTVVQAAFHAQSCAVVRRTRALIPIVDTTVRAQRQERALSKGPESEEAERSRAGRLLASTKAALARSASEISGRPTPKPVSGAPLNHTTRNATIPRTGRGSLQITGAMSHGLIDRCEHRAMSGHPLLGEVTLHLPPGVGVESHAPA